jgi:amino acid adenylation domain-containing protein
MEATAAHAIRPYCATSGWRLDELVQPSATLRPHAVAVVFGAHQRTYAELDTHANQIARIMHQRGVMPGLHVAICVERSLDLVAVLLGIVRCGGVLVPLDIALPDDRIETIVADAAPVLVLTHDRHRARFVESAVVTLEDVLREARDASAEPYAASTAADDLAYIMYTSGSTGTPKGVMVEHRSACNMLISALTDFDLDATDRVLQLASLSFDPAIWQIFGTLAAGATIVMPPPGTERDAAAIGREIERHGVTVVIAVPAILNLLMDLDTPALRSVRIAVSGGATLPLTLRDRCRALGIPLYNVYGPTEAAMHATTHRCDVDDERPFVPIGTPIANMRIHVLDETFAPVGRGDIGEIYIGGIGVARGYLHRDALTAERFLPDVFSHETGARLYRTGDLGRVHADGAIEFVGRIDDQVKVRGVRVEIGEVVTALERHPAVASACAVVNGDRLDAYVVLRTRDDGIIEAVRSHAHATLPPAAVPSTLTAIDAIPVGPSGKVDRSALPPPVVLANDEPVAIPNALSAVVLDLWESTLGVRGIGMHDSFFDVGGHSLLAAGLIVRIEERTGLRVPLPVFFAEPTIAGIVRALCETERAAYRPMVELAASGSEAPLFYMHGDISGMGLYCRRFGDVFGAERPVYVIAPHGIDGGPIPPTIEAMAADHVRAIREVAPHGPYVIGGFCFGGIVAFEVARQLEAQGERVQHVVLIESQDARQVFARYIEDPLLAALQALRIGERPRSVFRLLLRKARARWQAWRLPAQVDDSEAGGDERLTRIVEAQHRAVERYGWRPIRAAGTMLCAREVPRADAARTTAMWSSLFGSLDVEIVDGNHQTALGKHIDSLTAAITRALHRSTG